MSEKLEFSMRDLGRLARHIGSAKPVLAWVTLRTTTYDELKRATAEILAGYEEEED